MTSKTKKINYEGIFKTLTIPQKLLLIRDIHSARASGERQGVTDERGRIRKLWTEQYDNDDVCTECLDIFYKALEREE